MSLLSSLSPTRLAASGGLVLAVAAGSLALPAATLAKGGSPAISAAGACTIHSTSHLKGKHDNGRIEIEFEVDQNRNNRAWRVTLSDNGHRIFTGTRVTRAPSGSFTVRLLAANRTGRDRLVARAVNVRTGEVCRATIGL